MKRISVKAVRNGNVIYERVDLCGSVEIARNAYTRELKAYYGEATEVEVSEIE